MKKHPSLQYLSKRENLRELIELYVTAETQAKVNFYGKLLEKFSIK